MKITTQYGFDLILRDGSFMASEMDIQKCYELPESNLVASLVHPGDFCIDAGAHVGFYSCLMGSLGAKVLAVEPNPMHHENLKINTDKFEVGIIHKALSDVQGVVRFNVPFVSNDGCGSLYATDAESSMYVQTVRLDSIVGADQHIHFVKLDVEGSEAPALRGLGKCLANVDYILVECTTHFVPDSVDRINEILEGWKVKGFSEAAGWQFVEKAKPIGNFLFMNPRIA